MDEDSLVKIYGVVGAALFAFSINLFWLQDTGSPILKAIIPHPQLASAILIGTFAISIVGLFLLLISQRYWVRTKVRPWYVRLPPAFVTPSEPDDPLAILVRLIGFGAFIVVPAYVAGHFILFLRSVDVIDRRQQFNGLQFWSLTDAYLAPGTWGGDNRFRIGTADGVSFFPMVETIILVSLVALLVGCTAFQIFRFARNAWRQPQKAARS